MHRVHRAAAGGGGDGREQRRGVDAEAHLLAFHVPARGQRAGRLVDPHGRQHRIAGLLGQQATDQRGDEDQRHRRQRRHGSAKRNR